MFEKFSFKDCIAFQQHNRRNSIIGAGKSMCKVMTMGMIQALQGHLMCGGGVAYTVECKVVCSGKRGRAEFLQGLRAMSGSIIERDGLTKSFWLGSDAMIVFI